MASLCAYANTSISKDPSLAEGSAGPLHIFQGSLFEAPAVGKEI